MTISLRPRHREPLTIATPSLTRPAGVTLVRAADDLWRVVTAQRRVIGHVQAVWEPLGVRYRAKRFHAATARFRDLGDFWSVDEAVESLRR